MGLMIPLFKSRMTKVGKKTSLPRSLMILQRKRPMEALRMMQQKMNTLIKIKAGLMKRWYRTT